MKTARAQWCTARAQWCTARAQWCTARAQWVTKHQEWISKIICIRFLNLFGMFLGNFQLIFFLILPNLGLSAEDEKKVFLI